MNPSVGLFRGFMLAILGCAIVSGVLSIGFPELVPEPIRQADELVSNSTGTARVLIAGLLTVAVTVATLVAFVGLYLFKPWARPLNVWLAASVFILWPLLDYNVSSGWAQAFNDTAGLLWGVVLGMAYFSTLSERFKEEDL
jgi:hypothetical protein